LPPAFWGCAMSEYIENNDEIDGDENESETHRFSISGEYVGVRVDKALSALHEDLSRARVQALMNEGQAFLNGKVWTSASTKLVERDEITDDVPAPTPWYPKAEDIPLEIVYEDERLIVINKQAGLVVHPGAGNATGTLVN